MARFSDYVIGALAPFLGIVTSMQENVEYHLRVGSLVVGIIVGVLAIVRHFKTK